MPTDDDDTGANEDEEGSAAEGARERGSEAAAAAAAEATEVEQGGDVFCSSSSMGLTPGANWAAPRPLADMEPRSEGGGGLTGAGGPLWGSSGRKEGSGVLQLLSTVCESGLESRASRDANGKDRGGVCGGEEEGGRALVEEEEEEDDDEGVGAGSKAGGLEGLGCDPPGAFTSPPPAKAAPLLSRSFLPGRRRRLATEEEQGEEVEEEVLEVGVTVLAFRRVGLATLDGAKTFLCCCCWLPALLRSLPPPAPLRDGSDSGSEHGFRNGERLSLSRRNTTAMEDEPLPLTTAPLGPRRSTPSFPAVPGALVVPVVLLTPSRTRTDTLDCSLAFLPPAFLEWLDLPDSFLAPFSFLVLRARLAEEEAAVRG